MHNEIIVTIQQILTGHNEDFVSVKPSGEKSDFLC